nr:protein pitchfork isoform X1 [Pogona vitticeps]
MSKQHHSAAVPARPSRLLRKPTQGGLGPYPWQLQGAAHMKSVLGMLSQQRQLAWELTAAQKRNSFGSCQERRIFPFFHAPDRLGNEHVPIKGNPNRGPGMYNHAEKNTILYHLSHRPESTKGYSLGARTSPRFGLSTKQVAPDPTVYQALWVKDHKHKPAYAPFQSYTPRFSEQHLDKEFFPGPGTYDPEKMPHRHVTWPGMFGSPDWSLVPKPVKRTFKTELLSDKEFRKNRNLMAYLSIYYND